MATRSDNIQRSHIHCAEDARRIARWRLPRLVFDFVDGATGRETCARKNEEAFDRIELTPRALAPSAERKLAADILGQSYARPFGISPMGMCNLVRPGADMMLARTARAQNIPLCVSSAASTTLEDMHDRAGTNAWFQLYVQGDPKAALGMAERAARAGYGTLVLTVDVPQVSRRLRDLRNGFILPFRIGPRQFFDFARHPRWSLATLRHGLPAPANFQGGTGFDRNASRAGANWTFLDRLRATWRGKLVIKGVLSAEDAVRIRDAGADCVWVSNHGGRQLDAAPAAITVLSRIREAVGPGYPLIFDSGVRHGEDILRALALGADFVMLGRPVLYAIGAEGEGGLAAFLNSLGADLDIALAQLGLSDVRQVDRSVLAGTGTALSNSESVGLKLASALT